MYRQYWRHSKKVYTTIVHFNRTAENAVPYFAEFFGNFFCRISRSQETMTLCIRCRLLQKKSLLKNLSSAEIRTRATNGEARASEPLCHSAVETVRTVWGNFLGTSRRLFGNCNFIFLGLRIADGLVFWSSNQDLTDKTTVESLLGNTNKSPRSLIKKQKLNKFRIKAYRLQHWSQI